MTVTIANYVQKWRSKLNFPTINQSASSLRTSARPWFPKIWNCCQLKAPTRKPFWSVLIRLFWTIPILSSTMRICLPCFLLLGPVLGSLGLHRHSPWAGCPKGFPQGCFLRPQKTRIILEQIQCDDFVIWIVLEQVMVVVQHGKIQMVSKSDLFSRIC